MVYMLLPISDPFLVPFEALAITCDYFFLLFPLFSCCITVSNTQNWVLL